MRRSRTSTLWLAWLLAMALLAPLSACRTTKGQPVAAEAPEPLPGDEGEEGEDVPDPTVGEPKPAPPRRIP